MTADPVATKHGCPFCNSEALRLWFISDVVHISCKKCGAQGPVVKLEFGMGKKTEAAEQAVAAWDRRPKPRKVKPLEDRLQENR